MNELNQRIDDFESGIGKMLPGKYTEILNSYQEHLSKIETEAGASEGINPIVESLLDALESGGKTEEEVEEIYIKLLNRLDKYINEELQKFKQLNTGVIIGQEISTDEATKVIHQIDGVISFLDSILKKEKDPIKQGDIQELLQLLRNYKGYIEEGIKQGEETKGYFEKFITQLEANFSHAIIESQKSGATNTSITDLLIQQLKDIRDLHDTYISEKSESQLEAERQREQSKENLLYEAYDVFGEDILTEVIGFYPGNFNTNTPELDIARDKIFDIGKMNDIDAVTEYGKSLSLSPEILELPGKLVREGTESAYDVISGVKKVETEEGETLAKTIAYFLQENPNFLDKFPDIKTPEEFKQKIIEGYGIALTGSVQESFSQLQSQLDSDKSLEIVFKGKNSQGVHEEQVIDFSTLFSDPTDLETYIADPDERFKAQRLARQKSIVSGMIFLERLLSEKPSDSDLGYYFEGIVSGVVSIGTLDFIDIPYIKEKAENALTVGILAMSLGHMVYRSNLPGIAHEKLQFRYNKRIIELFNTNKDLDEAGLRAKGIPDEEVKAIQELQRRNAILEYYKIEAQKSGNKNLELRLDKFQNSNLFFVRDVSYFHKSLQITFESSKLGRILSGASRLTTVGSVVNQGRRYLPSLPRDVEGNFVVRNWRRIKGISWDNLKSYHDTLIAYRYIPSEFSPGMNQASSRMLVEFVRAHNGEIPNIEAKFRDINGYLSHLNQLAGGMFDDDFKGAIEKHLKEIMDGKGEAEMKFNGIVECFEEKGSEAENIKAIFDGDKRVDFSRTPNLREIVLQQIREDIRIVNSGAVAKKTDFTSRLEKGKEVMNNAIQKSLGFEYEKFSSEQNQALRSHFIEKIETMTNGGGIDLENKLKELAGDIDTINKGLKTRKYNSVLRSFFTVDGKINIDTLGEFINHREEVGKISGDKAIETTTQEIDKFINTMSTPSAASTIPPVIVPPVGPDPATAAVADTVDTTPVETPVETPEKGLKDAAGNWRDVNAQNLFELNIIHWSLNGIDIDEAKLDQIIAEVSNIDELKAKLPEIHSDIRAFSSVRELNVLKETFIATEAKDRMMRSLLAQGKEYDGLVIMVWPDGSIDVNYTEKKGLFRKGEEVKLVFNSLEDLTSAQETTLGKALPEWNTLTLSSKMVRNLPDTIETLHRNASTRVKILKYLRKLR